MGQYLLEEEFFQKLNRLNYQLKLPLIHERNGNRKAIAKGNSIEFSDYRQYQLGDDIRRVDWNAYGRFEKFYIKEYREEKEALITIFLDTSRSMDFGEPKKSEFAIKLTAAFAYLVMNHLDRVQIKKIAKGGQLAGKMLAGRQQFAKVLLELSNVPFEGTTNLLQSIKGAPLEQRGMSIVISDFLTEESLEELILYLKYKKQEVLFFEVLSREERERKEVGTLELIDSETKERMKVTITGKSAKAYEERLLEHERKLKSLCKKYGIIFCQSISDEPFDKVLMEELGKTSFLQNRR